MYRRARGALEVLLVHPGGPFWAKKDAGAWSIPKGEYGEGEDPLAVARREFEEELGVAPEGSCVDLGEVIQPGRKRVRAFAIEGDFEVSGLRSNTFEMEWPPKSGRRQSFPEVDRAAWFTPDEAREKILVGQSPLIDRLLASLRAR
jgi:predicted NUDIX family NTP pyrophosphohydrolase